MYMLGLGCIQNESKERDGGKEESTTARQPLGVSISKESKICNAGTANGLCLDHFVTMCVLP